MNLVNNIKNFLYDQKYVITFYENKIHLFNFEKITKFTSNELKFKFKTFNLTLKGDKFLIKKMLEKEVLVVGIIKNFNIEYEENMA